MNKRSFFNRQDTAITLLYKPASITQAIATARNGESDGADGIAIEIQRLPQEEQACGNISTTPPFLILESLDYGCLLCSSFEPKLREGRTFVSIVFTLVLAQGLTHRRCSVSVCGRKGWKKEATEHERGYGRNKGNGAVISPLSHPFTQSPSDPVSVLPHLEGRAWACCLPKTLDSYSLWLP